VTTRKIPKCICPKEVEERAFVYLIGWKDGRVKVGMTKNPRWRIETHMRASEYAWFHFFAPMNPREAYSMERRALEKLGEIGTRVRKTETFLGLDRSVIAVIRDEWCKHLVSRARWRAEQVAMSHRLALRSVG